MASCRVFISDVVASVVFPAFSASSLDSGSFDVCRKIISRVVDNKGGTFFINITGNGCQGDSFRSLTCVMF